jgi:hypothetical protein
MKSIGPLMELGLGRAHRQDHHARLAGLLEFQFFDLDVETERFPIRVAPADDAAARRYTIPFMDSLVRTRL